MATVVDVLARLRADTSNYSTGMRRAAGETQALVNNVGGVGAAAKTGLGTAMGLLRGVGIAASVAAGVVGGIFASSTLQKGYQRLTTIQDATTQLTVSLGSAAKAAKFMDQILATVKGTPFNLDQFADAASQMVSLGANAKKVPQYMTAIGEAAAGKGKRAAEYVGRLSAAFGQAATMGRVTGDTLMQMEMAGVPATKILANTFGMTTEELKKLVSKGALPAEKAMDALTIGIMKGTKGAAGETKALAGTMKGLRNNLSGAVGGLGAAQARLGAAIIKPFNDVLVKGLNAAADGLDQFAKTITPVLEKVAKSPAVAQFVDMLSKAPAIIMKAFTAVAGVVVGVIGTIGPIIANVARTILPALIAGFQKIGAAVMKALPPILSFVRSGLQVMAGYAPIVARAIGVVATVIAALVTGLGKVLPILQPLLPLIIGIGAAWLTWSAASTAAGWVASGAKSVASNIQSMKTAVTTGAQTLTRLKEGYNDTRVAQSAFSGKAGSLGGILRKITDGAKSAGSALRSGFSSVASGISAAASAAASAASSVASMARSLAVAAANQVRAAASAVAHTAALVAQKAVQLAIAGATKVWAAAQWLLNAAMTANPIGLVIAGIAALAAAIYLAWTKSETFRKVVTGAFNAVVGAASALWNWVKTNWPTLLAILTGPIGIAVLLIKNHWNTIKQATTAAFNAVKTVVMTVLGWIRGYFQMMFNAYRTVVVAVWNAIVAAFRTAVSAVTGLVNAINSRILAAVNWFRQMPSRILSAVAGFASLLFNAGKQLVQGLMNGIRSMASGPINAIKQMGSNALNALKGALGIASPSKYTMQQGKFLGQGLAVGITSSQPMVLNAANGLGNAAVTALDIEARRVGEAAARVEAAARGAGVRTPTEAARRRVRRPGQDRDEQTRGYARRSGGRTAGAGSGRGRGRGRGRGASNPYAGWDVSAPGGGGGGGGGGGRGGGGRGGSGRGSPRNVAYDAANNAINAIRAGIQDRLNKAKEDVKAIKDQMAQLVGQIRDSLLDFGSITKGQTQLRGADGAKALIDDMKRRLLIAQDFAKKIADLKKQGLNNQSLQEIIAAGPEAGAIIAGNVLAGGASAIKEINALEDNLRRAGTYTGKIAADSAYGSQLKAREKDVATLERQKKAAAGTSVNVAKGGIVINFPRGVNAKDRQEIEEAIDKAVDAALRRVTRQARAR